MQPNETDIDVIIPVCNEEEMIGTFYNRIKRLPLKLNLIFIDNASSDKTLEKIQSFEDITIIEHEVNEGYGGSILDGIKHSKGDKIVIIDADCEYPPESIPILINELNNFDVIYGSRFLNRERINMPLLRVFGNKLISRLFNRLYNQEVTDLYTGFKAFKRSALNDITLGKKGFEHVLEMGIKFSQKKIPINEVSIEYTPRSAGQSKMKHITETLKFSYYLLAFKFKLNQA